MDSDRAWVNGKSGRQSWCAADAFKRSIISGATYHLPFTILPYTQLLVTLLANIQQFVDGVCRSVGIGRADLHFIDVGV